jgi:hypothetical protein
MVKRESYSSTVTYWYNDADSLVKKVNIMRDGDNTDSMLYYYKYDVHNRLVEFIQEPSPTYCRSFPLGCDAGAVHYHKFFSHDILNPVFENIDTNDYNLCRMYFKFGFIEKELGTSDPSGIYKMYYFANWGIQTMETMNGLYKRVQYEYDCDISERKCLPVFIEISDIFGYTVYNISYTR